MTEEEMKRRTFAVIELPLADGWEETYEGKCDICHTQKHITEVSPGVQYGWRVGYVCKDCKTTKPKE